MADSRMTERGASISITLNGEGREAPAGVTVAELLDHLDLRGRQVAVARNAEIVPRSDFETVRIEDGDRIEIVQAIGGGAGGEEAG
jgi:sulfur carrier protein